MLIESATRNACHEEVTLVLQHVKQWQLSGSRSALKPHAEDVQWQTQRQHAWWEGEERTPALDVRACSFWFCFTSPASLSTSVTQWYLTGWPLSNFLAPNSVIYHHLPSDQIFWGSSNGMKEIALERLKEFTHHSPKIQKEWNPPSTIKVSSNLCTASLGLSSFCVLQLPPKQVNCFLNMRCGISLGPPVLPPLPIPKLCSL